MSLSNDHRETGWSCKSWLTCKRIIITLCVTPEYTRLEFSLLPPFMLLFGCMDSFVFLQTCHENELHPRANEFASKNNLSAFRRPETNSSKGLCQKRKTLSLAWNIATFLSQTFFPHPGQVNSSSKHPRNTEGPKKPLCGAELLSVKMRLVVDNGVGVSPVLASVCSDKWFSPALLYSPLCSPDPASFWNVHGGWFCFDRF